MFSRAIQNVTANGYQDYGDEKANQVLHSIAAAIRILQNSHKVNLASDELQAIAQGEGLGEADPIRKIYHPLWFYLQNIRTELAVRGLKQANVDEESIIKVIDETRYNDARNQANSKIDSRRWKAEAFVSAEPQLAMLLSDLSLASQRLAPDRITARETLQKYVTDLVEQAREAAEAAKQAKQETDARDDNSESAVNKLAEELDGNPADAVEKATETVESLIDKANTTDILDQEQREIARDADAAASWIADAIQETKQAMDQAQQASTDQDREQSLEKMEENLGALAERLETTAKHFEQAEQGDDLTESREQLRQAEQDVQAKAELDDRYQRAEQMAEAAKQDPRALLEKLELELQRNEKMQDALDDIAIDMVKESAKRLKQAARDEQELNTRLENGDLAFEEKKRQNKMLLNEFKERANSLRERTLGAAAQASGWANESEQQQALEQIREDLNAAVNEASPAINENATLGEMQSANETMQQATSKAAEQAKQSAAAIDKSVDKDLHGDEKRRDQTAAKLRRELNQLKNEEVRAIDRQRGTLNSEQREAGKRVNQANKDARSAEDAVKRAQENLKKNPDDQGAQNEIERQQDRLSDAKRFGEEARRTKDLSRERRTKADDRANSINSKPTSKLEKPNPAAQMAANSAREAAERLEALADDLGELKKQSDIADELRTRREITEDISNKQRQVQGDVKLSADELARAARHEERMGEKALAKRLDKASERTSENAGVPAEQAAGKIADAEATPAKSAAAGKALKQAAKAIDQQADAIADLLNESVSESADPSSPEDASQAESSESSSPPPSADASQAAAASQSGSSPEDAKAKQMAQTLDELDRSLNGQPSQQQPGEQQSGEQQGSQQPGSQQSGQQQQGSQQQGAGQQRGNAMEASPTLARMLEAQRQQAARERMKGLQETSGVTESSQPNQQAEKPTTESGQGEPPGGKQDVDLLDGEITDGDWGGLRERVVDDANQGKSTRIPPGYSREVQAYFKALSKRAAEAK